MASSDDQLYDWQLQDRLMSLNSALRSCEGGCGKTQENVQLRKCARCESALYCSKQCQKRAWPVHKITCSTLGGATASPTPTTATGELPTNSSSLGSDHSGSSLSSLAATLREFSVAHDWAFRSLAKALILQNAGSIDSWSQNPALMNLNFFLSPTALSGVRGRRGDPARTFRLTSYFFTPLNELLAQLPDGSYLARQEQAHQRAEDMWRRNCPDYVGVLNLMFIAEGMENGFARLIPLFRGLALQRPIQSLPPIWEDGPFREIILESIVLLSKGSINAGIPFRPVEGSAQRPEMVVALPGKFVRGENASWSWTALFSHWDDYKPGDHQQLDDLINMMPSLQISIPPWDTITTFNIF